MARLHHLSDQSSQRLIGDMLRSLQLRGRSSLSQHLAGPTFGDALCSQSLPHPHHCAFRALRRAYEVSRGNFQVRICLSKDRSATSFFNRAFSVLQHLQPLGLIQSKPVRTPCANGSRSARSPQSVCTPGPPSVLGPGPPLKITQLDDDLFCTKGASPCHRHKASFLKRRLAAW